MNSKKVKELDDILQKIQSATGLSIGEISLKAQRNKGYIAQLKSRAKAGEDVPDKFLSTLKLIFAKELQNANSEKGINTGIDSKDVTQRMFEMLIANNALTKVLKADYVALKASVTGKSISSVNLQIEKDAEDQLAHDLKEYEKYSG